MMINNITDNGRRHSHRVPIMFGAVIKMLMDKGQQQLYVKIIITKKEDISKISTELG